MPQSSSGSTTKKCDITLVKDGDEFRVLEISGGTITRAADGTQMLEVELAKDELDLRFATADLRVGTDTYVVEASTVVGEQSKAWTLGSGKSRSPLVERDPDKELVTQEYTKSMTLSFVVKGPVVAGTPPPQAGTVKPPTTVVIRSRLDWP